MAPQPTSLLSDTEIEAIRQEVFRLEASGDLEEAFAALDPLLRSQENQKDAAIALLKILRDTRLPMDKVMTCLEEVEAAHPEDGLLRCFLGEALQSARDIDDLNAAPPEHPIYKRCIDRLSALAETAPDHALSEKALSCLASAARLVGRQYDDLVENTGRRLTKLDPEYSAYFYNLGLFYKTRGRFQDGMAVNQQAVALSTETVEAYEWNLGICATGAGAGEVALAVWQRMGQKIAPGRFGLPEGRYPSCKVRLAERPLAERDAATDSPGREETIWIERLSPCHGIVRSVLYEDLGVDYGDVVLFDGAPITYHKYGDTQIPVHPHLATLLRNDFAFYDFSATQAEAGNVDALNKALDGDAVVYVHSENMTFLCKTCWRDPKTDHERHESEEKHVVRGRIAVPPEISAAHFLRLLDAAVTEAENCQLYAPDLCAAAGDPKRAAVAQRRFDILRGNRS